MRLEFPLVVAGLLVVSYGCSSEAPGQERESTADVGGGELVAARAIRVLGSEDLDVMDISAVSLDPGDSMRMAVVDRSRQRVVLVDLDSQSVVASTNGAVRRPIDVTFRGDQVLISEVNPVVHIADPRTLEVAGTIQLQQSLFAKRVHPTSHGFIAEGTDTHDPSASLFEYSIAGDLLRSWHGFSSADVAPFWGEFFWEHAAVNGDDIYVGSAMRYPLVHYGSQESRSTFGKPPPDYRAPRRPERFEFSGAGEARVRYEEFVRSFTMISSVWTTDQYLIVEHRDLDPAEMSHRSAAYTLDIYDLETLRKTATQVPAPGPILDVAASEVLILTSQPPTGDWIVTAFRVSVDRNEGVTP